VTSPASSALLVDRGFEDTGEEQKVYTQGDRVITLSKKIVPERWDEVGESIGFFKIGAGEAPELLRMLAGVVAHGTGLEEYEESIHLLAHRRPLGWVDVTGLPWTEIDFVEDLRRADAEVLPRVVRLDGA
jgi:choline kinase